MPDLTGVVVSGSGSVRFDGFRGGDPRGLDLSVSGSGNIDGTGCTGRDFAASVSGSGNVDVSDCSMERAEVQISGSGNVVIHTGARPCRAQILSLRISGSGTAHVDGCVFENADVLLSGSGDGTLAIGGGNLAGSLSGSGSLDYRGNPRVVDARTSGSGTIRKLG